MNEHIPKQIKGHHLDCRDSADFAGLDQANEFYEIAKNRLLSIEQWDDISQFPAATFSLYQDHTNLAEKNTLTEGAYVKIKVPLPSRSNEEGYDWVQIEGIHVNEDKAFKRIAITLRPSEDPTQKSSETAHFFTANATSTICVEQKDNVVSAVYAGRNQSPNTDTSSLSAEIRNRIVTIGAKLGASYPQWKALVNGLVRK
ncbi:hypothetical protein M8998_02870 [Sphingobacterium sp. lm-10]|uniref:hypothetical protein n=1 Tax=Sphingobacterium sp. lm-10 TaxID=2944904 RepID=UPI0020225741|nr:hypothetical protein [Sphingobacterium sp. lm-10]MCL7986878.1 hypothetical protein [Sphingobacterium sp. lm-10]